ncbi:MAG: BlaI/MecI/CopY family transcriptional regulator [Thermoanaerobaculia bacterium]|nr:BlaI/MecI/CopY family transcriptional regulator [Thermoanaerobaculia bacterium]
MRRKSRTLTDRELDVMKIVWKLDTATVRQVHELMRIREPKVAYTTVMTLLKILEEKRYLERTPQGRAYVYAPTRPRAEVITDMVKEFVDRVFNGSAQPLLLSLVKSQDLSEEDLDEIAQAIRESE